MAGLVLAMQAGANLLGQITGGRLFDRFGGKPIIVGGLLSAVAMLTVIGLVRSGPSTWRPWPSSGSVTG